MGLLTRLIAGELRAGAPGPTDDYWYRPVGEGPATPAGVQIDSVTAQKISAWYRGRDILATVLAMLPLPVLERLPNDGGSTAATTNPLYDVLHDKPNVWQDSFQWRRQKMYHLIDDGNTYDWITPGPRGAVDQLRPISPPRRVTPEQIKSGAFAGRILYHVRDEQTGKTTTHTQDEIFHLRGASEDGVKGIGILAAARSSLGTALATETYAGLIFGRGTLNGGVIENPGQLDLEASKRMAESFVTAARNWHLPKILEQGSKWVQNDMSPEDFQMLLSRKFTVDDVARWLGVPRQMLENSDPSFGNAEQFDQNFISYSMGPWLSLWEFGIRDQLILNPRRFFAQFTRQALLRGNLGMRWTAHVAAVNAGIVTVDEVRGVEDLNKRGGKADELRDPANITGKPAAGDPAAPTPPPPPRPAPATDPAKPTKKKATAIATASAARVLRKEIAAVQKLAVRHATDADAFAVAITEFYVGHVALVGQTLLMDETDAQRYCAGQAAQLVVAGSTAMVSIDWLAALTVWATDDYAAGLAGLALEAA